MKKMYFILLVGCFVLVGGQSAFVAQHGEAYAWLGDIYDDSGWFTVNQSASWTVDADVWIESGSGYAAASVYTKDNDHWMASVELSSPGEDSDYDSGTKQVSGTLDFRCVANIGVFGSGDAEAWAYVVW